MSSSSLFSISSRPVRWLLVALGALTILHVLEQSFDRQSAIIEIAPSSYDWSILKPFYPVNATTPLPGGKPHKLRRVQHPIEKPHKYDIGIQQQRCKAIRTNAEKVWKSHKERVWMQDEFSSAKGGRASMLGGWQAGLIDSLDTLWLLGLKREFRDAVEAIAKLDWNRASQSCNVRETTTRYLGGLLSAYDLSGEKVLLVKAKELGEMLYTAFDTPNHLPPLLLDLEKVRTGQMVTELSQSAASIAGLSLEMTRLSQLSGDPKYYSAIDAIYNKLELSQNATKVPGLWPSHFDAQEDIFSHDNQFSLGETAGAMYEALIKMHALTGALDERYEIMFTTASTRIIDNLLFRPSIPKKHDILLPGVFRVGDKTPLDPHVEHYACSAGAAFAYAGRLFNETENVNIGAKLTHGCMFLYSAFSHGLMPEKMSIMACPNKDSCKFNEEDWIKALRNDYDGREDLLKGILSASDPSFQLKPEAIESIFYMYRITGHEQYREAAWTIYQAIVKATETDYGNAAVADITRSGNLQHRDALNSNDWFTQTMKYLYLIFSPAEYISLDDYVFTTAGHPFKIPKA